MKHLWAAMTIVLVSGAAFGQVAPAMWPRCIAARDGQQLGLGGSVCECRYEAGGTMLRRPAGWRWSCDMMRMDGYGDDGAAGPSAPPSLPPGFVYAPQSNAPAPEPRLGGPSALFDGTRRR